MSNAKFKKGDIVKVVDATGSLDGCNIKLGATGKVVECLVGFITLVIEINGRLLFVCEDEIELVAREVKPVWKDLN